MTKSCNLTDMEIYRRSFSNALFNSHYRAFDAIFRMIDISSKPSLFVEDRIDGSETSKDFFKRFTMYPIIHKKKDVDRFINKGGHPSTPYFLIGKRGVGKSTLLRQYFNNNLKDKLKTAIFLDLYGMPVSENRVEKYIWKELQLELKKNKDTKIYYEKIMSAKEVRPLFKELTNEKIVEMIYLNDIEYTKDVFLHLAKSRRIYLIIDNTDELGIKLVEKIFLISNTLANNYPVKVIFALRDYLKDKLFKKLRRQIQPNSTFLHPPKIEQILKKRIEHLDLDSSLPINIEYITTDKHYRRAKSTKLITIEDVKRFLIAIIDEAFEGNKTIPNNLFKLCNYDVREVLDNMYNFFHSCKLPLTPIFQKIILKKLDKKRKVSFDDFIACFLTVHTVCYDYKSSRLFNLFDTKRECTSQTYRNTIGLLRILQRCTLKQPEKLENMYSFTGLMSNYRSDP